MYNGFISYSHSADDKFAPPLQNALQKFAKPWYKKRNLEIFRDESSLSASPHLWDNITKALDQSEYLILLASPFAENSHWVNEEVNYWLEHKSIDTILLVLTEGEIAWDIKDNKFLNPNNNSLPPALDNVFKNEPFYVDLRQSKTYEDLTLDNPIFKKEILKLAAILHNKPPNELASDEVSEHRKMILLRNSALVLLLVLLGISIFQTYSAKRQTKIAIQEKLNTETEKKKVQKAYDSITEFVSKGIGKKFMGGVIFEVNAERTQGLIAATEDLKGSYNFERAKKACQSYSIQGDDRGEWRLPSKDELEKLYTKKEEVGGFGDDFNYNGFWYWSSSPVDENNESCDNCAFMLFFKRDKISASTASLTNDNGHVRPIRSFSIK